MKYSTTTILATLAASAAATSNACPDDVTATLVKTETCAESTIEVWQTTVTVSAPAVKTVTVGADGKSAKQAWENWKPTLPVLPLQPVHSPQGCAAASTVTSVVSVKQPGSITTKTGSTLFVGVGGPAKTTVTVTAAADMPGVTAGSELPKQIWNGADSSIPGKALGDDGQNDKGMLSLSVGDQGVGVGIGGWGVTISEKLIATGTEAFQWTIAPTGVTKSFVDVPQYTQKPDGKFGFDWNDWGSWNDGSGKGKGNAPGKSNNITLPGKPNNSTLPTTGKNSTIPSPGKLIGAPTPGSPGSNVTEPFASLTDSSCNSASNRGTWCNGKSVKTDIQDYYSTGKICPFEFTLTNGTADFDGDEVMSLLINGQSPGPMIECNWGDTIQVTVHNKLQTNGTSIHWHGIRMVGENNMDGVPGVTECPMAPGESRTYSFLASSYGTGWYHSHWMTQSGDGIKGPIVIHGPATANYDIDAGVVQLDDTFETTAAQWNYLTSKTGPLGTKNYLINGKNVHADLSAGQHALWEIEAGKKYLFRFINQASQNMFSVSLDNHKMKVIAADFMAIQPYETQWLNIAIGQRYDVIIEMDQQVDSYFLRAVTQTGCPSQCDNTGLGQANGIVAYKGVSSTPYLLPTSTTDRKLSDFNICDDEPLASLVPYVAKSAGSLADFQKSVETIPGGDVSYVETSDDGRVTRWFLNNGWQNITFSDPTLMQLNRGTKNGSRPAIDNSIVLTKKNAWYYFVIQNQFIAGHPMHLHGHDFSILGQGSGVFDQSMAAALNFDNPMRRDTGMLKGIESQEKKEQGWTVIAIQTDNPGAWLMHCHIVWHVDGGLSLQWIERPDEIPLTKYVGSDFKGMCSAYSKYEATSPSHMKTSGQSGLKRSVFFEERVAEYNTRKYARQAAEKKRGVGAAEKKFLADHKAKRGIGHRHYRQ